MTPLCDVQRGQAYGRFVAVGRRDVESGASRSASQGQPCRVPGPRSRRRARRRGGSAHDVRRPIARPRLPEWLPACSRRGHSAQHRSGGPPSVCRGGGFRLPPAARSGRARQRGCPRSLPLARPITLPPSVSMPAHYAGTAVRRQADDPWADQRTERDGRSPVGCVRSVRQRGSDTSPSQWSSPFAPVRARLAVSRRGCR